MPRNQKRALWKLKEKSCSLFEQNVDKFRSLYTSITGSEDKLWADVDKDIGELLREVDPQGNEGSDDDDDLDRYEKFRKSDKTNDGAENDTNAADSTNEKTVAEDNAAA